MSETPDDESSRSEDDTPAGAKTAPRKRPKPGERRVQILQVLAGMLEQPGTERITPTAVYDDPALTFSPGSYTLQAVATDLAGNQAVSAEVHIHIEPPAAPTTGETPTSTTTPEPASSSSSSTGFDVGLEIDPGIDDDGCGCRHAPRPLPFAALLLLLAIRRSRPADNRSPGTPRTAASCH